MRHQNKILFVMLLFTTFTYGEVNGSSAFKISISVPQRSFRLGEPIVAHVSLKNTSTEKIVVARANGSQQAQFNYHIVVTDQSGHRVPYISHNEQAGRIHKPTAWSNVGVDLSPNETLEEDCEITRIFMLKAPGKYLLEFTRPILKSNDKVAHSNRLTITIVR